MPRAAARIRRLDEVGLGYLRLGQSATTLSGGEAQRIKLAKGLAQRSTGLHVADTARLLGVLQQIVAEGTPGEVARVEASRTGGVFARPFMRRPS
ncbi:hypothetical protein [Streptomyces winkii]|uniref:hypothetical protein n=1 Tax=Streptomyces winkii TaxID=3051178 RepID=UPI0037D9EA6F